MFLEKVTAHKTIALNHQGLDFFVGDIHGQKQQLIKQLDSLGFNYEGDRLFCAGDIIDRGPESQACLDLLMQPWFFSTLGNHEALFLQGFEQAKYWQILLNNGGQWITELMKEPSLLHSLAQLIRIKMPLSYSVTTPEGIIGVIHAEAPENWLSLKNLNVNEHTIVPLIWQRRNLQSPEGKTIENVHAVVHGHNAIATPMIVNNQLWLDTFKKAGAFTILSADDILKLIKA